MDDEKTAKKANPFLARIEKIRSGRAEERTVPSTEDTDEKTDDTIATGREPKSAKANPFLARIAQIRSGTAEPRAEVVEATDSDTAVTASSSVVGTDATDEKTEAPPKPKKKRMTPAERIAAKMAARRAGRGQPKKKKKRRKKKKPKVNPLLNTAALKTRNAPLRDYRTGIPKTAKDKVGFKADLKVADKVFYKSTDDQMYAPGDLMEFKGRDLWRIGKLVSEKNFTFDKDNPVYIRKKPVTVKVSGYYKVLREKDFEVELSLGLARIMAKKMEPEIRQLHIAAKYRKQAAAAMTKIGKDIDEVGSNITGAPPKRPHSSSAETTTTMASAATTRRTSSKTESDASAAKKKPAKKKKVTAAKKGTADATVKKKKRISAKRKSKTAAE